MKKVTTRLIGGLGNMMFQIACTLSYSLKYGKEAIYSYDDSVVVHKHASDYKGSVFSKINFVSRNNMESQILFNESGFNYTEIPNVESNICLNGYFQSEKYFKEHRKEVLEIFSYPQELAESISKKYIDLLNKNTCSIHVRRGDYLKFQDHHPIQSMNYYMKAIKHMDQDSVFLIFSDDIYWCKQNFPDLPEKFVFIDENKDYEELFLMSKCKNNIICNSTFSWWGAWLNKNDQKKVVAPAKWFGSAYDHYNTNDLYCENWIKI